jgi:plastocyanin
MTSKEVVYAIRRQVLTTAFVTLSIVASAAAAPPMDKNFYLPNAQASKILSVSKTGTPEAEVIVLTQAVAIKETGPKETVAKFGEVYAFSPTFIAVRREVPTMLTFWNLQPDDEHDFMLAAPDSTVLMHLKLMPLTKTSYVFTFHEDGIFNFYCAVHQPEMNGQILVLPPTTKWPRVVARFGGHWRSAARRCVACQARR